MTKLRMSNCDNLNCDNIQKQTKNDNSKTQIVTKPKSGGKSKNQVLKKLNSNCDNSKT